MSVRTRPAVRSDTAAVVACAREAYAPFISLIGEDAPPFTTDYSAQIDDGIVHVAVSETDRLLGFIVFRGDDDTMVLENVAVLPTAAGRGVGRELIRLCEAAAVRDGLAQVRLFTSSALTANLTIYPRLGYVEIARSSAGSSQRIRFEKRLRAP